jgi:hypothetical protein
VIASRANVLLLPPPAADPEVLAGGLAAGNSSPQVSEANNE